MWALCIASIVLFVPGLSIANALECLAFNDLVSGTSLLGQSALTLIKLFVGIIMGLNIGEAIWGQAVSIDYTNAVPMWMHISGLVLISVSIGVMFNARPKDILLGLPVAVLGMWGHSILVLIVAGLWVLGLRRFLLLCTELGLPRRWSSLALFISCKALSFWFRVAEY